MKKLSKKTNANISLINNDNIPEKFDFPSFGIEDVDRAIFDLFDKKIKFEVTSNETTKSVPVIFSTGERFALTRRKKAIRDKNNANILPLISISRKDIDISSGQGGKGTAISFRSQPNYTIKYRLAEKDRNFQNVINKSNIQNQENVSSKNRFIDPFNQINVFPENESSRRKKENLKFSKHASINLNNQINTNIFEIIQIPYPYFYTVTYDIVFWTQYVQQSNEMIEYLLNKIDVPGGEFAITTDKGFEIVAFISDSISYENNFDSMTDDERLIKHSFSLVVPAYLINPSSPGAPSQIRSYFSSPTIDFSYLSTTANVELPQNRNETKEEMINRHVLTDLTNDDNLYNVRGETSEILKSHVENPFSNSEEKEYLRIINSNARSGESVISQRIIKEIDKQYE